MYVLSGNEREREKISGGRGSRQGQAGIFYVGYEKRGREGKGGRRQMENGGGSGSEIKLYTRRQVVRYVRRRTEEKDTNERRRREKQT